jgi:hypothetical protein
MAKGHLRRASGLPREISDFTSVTPFTPFEIPQVRIHTPHSDEDYTLRGLSPRSLGVQRHPP